MLTNFRSITFINLFLLAIFIRLLIMPFYFHPDIKTYHFQASFFRQGVWNIYTYLETHKELLPLKEEFVYFPLTYIFLGSYQILISPFLGDNFLSWLSNASSGVTDSIGIFRYLFLLKIPYLFLDIVIAFLIIKFTDEKVDKRKLFTLWLFNPFSIILIYVFSNIDIIPVTLTILSLLLAYKRKLILAALLLGIAAGFKAYPLLFLPFLLIYGKGIKQIALMILASIGIFSLIIYPFWSLSFQKAALVSGLTTRIVSSGFSINFGENLIPFIVSFSALFFLNLIKVNKNEIKNLPLNYLAVLLLLFSFIHFHIQWLLWIIPFIVLLSINSEKLFKATLFLIALAFMIPILYDDSFMSVSLLRTYSSLYSLLPTPFSIVQRIYDPYIVQSILHSFILGGSLIIIWQLFKEKKT